MVFRREQRDPRPPPGRHAWQDQFDAAAALITSGRQPAWITDRLGDMEAALSAAEADIERLSAAIDHLDPEQTAARLKHERRTTPTDPDGERPMTALQRRFDTVNELMNQREELRRRIADSIVDLELLAAEALRPRSPLTATDTGVDEALARLQLDLRAIEDARSEIRSL